MRRTRWIPGMLIIHRMRARVTSFSFVRPSSSSRAVVIAFRISQACACVREWFYSSTLFSSRNNIVLYSAVAVFNRTVSTVTIYDEPRVRVRLQPNRSSSLPLLSLIFPYPFRSTTWHSRNSVFHVHVIKTLNAFRAPTWNAYPQR